MAENEEPERIWDEYDWERFLQQQDRNTEHYMELLEKYMDDPNRDQIIAKEMGWYHLLDEKGEDWLENTEAAFDEIACKESETDVNYGKGLSDGFETNPLYQASFALTVWIDELLDELGDLQNHPAAIKLATQSAIASAKLAAALSDDDAEEIGMTIAYLKRALKAINNAVEAGAQLKKEIKLTPKRYAVLNERIFQIRDGIVDLMGKCRMEWRRRFGDR